MSLVGSISEHLRPVDPHARIALAAECGERVCPIYEDYWVGTYTASVRRSVELAWAWACGKPSDGAEIAACIAEIEDLVAVYSDEEQVEILAEVMIAILYMLRSLSEDQSDSCLAVARCLSGSLGVAQSAEAMANWEVPIHARVQRAVMEEEVWQASALAIVNEWCGAVRRDMFDSAGPKPPHWFLDWKRRSRR